MSEAKSVGWTSFSIGRLARWLAINVIIGLASTVIGLVAFYGLLVLDHNRDVRSEYGLIHSVLEVRGILDEKIDAAAEAATIAAELAYEARRSKASADIQEAAVLEYERAAKNLNALVGDELLDPLTMRREASLTKSILNTLVDEGGVRAYTLSVALVMFLILAGTLLTSPLRPKEEAPPK